jgi:hypothetical protein
MNAARLVLRASSADIDQRPADKSTDKASPFPLPKPEQANRSSSKLSTGTPLMIIPDGHPPDSRHAKRASVLQLGDAIRLGNGKRVVITYASRGFAPTERYIEWRGHGPNNWANVALDTPVRLAWRIPRVGENHLKNFISLGAPLGACSWAISKVVLADFGRTPHPR